MVYSEHFSTRKTAQTSPIPGKSQVKNSAGGFVFAVTPWQQFERFLVLGSTGGTYYASESKLSRENAQVVLDVIDEYGFKAIDRIVEVSTNNEAPGNSEAVFAMALALKLATSAETRRYASLCMSKVCRIGTHWFELAEHVKNLGGWGSVTRRTFATFFEETPIDRLVYQCLKYKQRNGWSMRDLLRKCHAQTSDPKRNSVFKAIVSDEWDAYESFSDYHAGYNYVREAKTVGVVEHTIDRYKLTREVVPTEWLNKPEVLEALAEKAPLHALIRNLGNMSKAGLLTRGSTSEGIVLDKLTPENLKRSKVHPFTVLLALKTYSAGRGFRGSGSWEVQPGIVDALDRAFYDAFGNVAPSGAHTLIALDISGSMGWSAIRNTNITPREASTALCMVTAASEGRNCIITAFAGNGLVLADLSPRRRLDDNIRTTDAMGMGRTDCSLPMVGALEKNLLVDHFVVYTDNETYAGQIHPCQALQQYRRESGINAKLTVVGMTSTGFTIADPSDAGMLDVVGFSASCPQLIANFGKPE